MKQPRGRITAYNLLGIAGLRSSTFFALACVFACVQAKLAKLRRELLEPSKGGGGGGAGEGE
jgi:hypothetical protein